MNEDYMAFMLRLRRSPDRPHWRASLENAHTGTVHHFTSEEELCLFLADRLASRPLSPDQDLGPDREATHEE
jgi:hypothetical protein